MSKEVKRYTTFHGGLHAAPEGEIVMWYDYDALATQYAELKQANADLDRLASQTAALNERAGMRVYELEQALRMAREWLAGWGSAERELAAIDAALSQQPSQNSERP